jgi:hypothetical protein
MGLSEEDGPDDGKRLPFQSWPTLGVNQVNQSLSGPSGPLPRGSQSWDLTLVLC